MITANTNYKRRHFALIQQCLDRFLEKVPRKPFAMKFAVFLLLGLCAAAAHASYEGYNFDFEVESFEARNGVTDKIKDMIKGFMKAATDEFSKVAGKVKAIIEKVNEQMGDLAVKAKNKANEIKSEVQGKINEMKQKGGEVAACAKKLEPEYWQVEKDVMAEVKKCAGDAYVSTEEMREEVGRGMAAIRTSLRDLGDIVGSCLGWNPVSSAKCVYGKMSEMKKIADDIMASSKAALRASQMKSVEIMNKAHECNAKALANGKERVKELNQRLAKCYNAYEDIMYY